jgi:hypothetical protein
MNYERTNPYVPPRSNDLSQAGADPRVMFLNR